ncbi:MAG: nuclear transport factor 2 family protein [Devosia sp.]|uniref:nuclear transport factor 2 family protein n=1 Tax=Devosia sp. TaxID=1871048 RepID=UPI001AC057F8|nr:nuclear transport factor 2 family protein [Devosia sp.]MBN9316449.1 nuclear transport factor 2 family protein [Devosia sp.]
MAEEGNVGIVRAYLAAIERFDVEVVGRYIDPSIEQVERPNRLYAKGQVRGREELLRDLPRGAQVLRRQSYPIATIFGAGDKVTVETRWEGILNVALGIMQPGDPMVAHICMVFTLRDGRIIRQVNYDCYEPF